MLSSRTKDELKLPDLQTSSRSPRVPRTPQPREDHVTLEKHVTSGTGSAQDGAVSARNQVLSEREQIKLVSEPLREVTDILSNLTQSLHHVQSTECISREDTLGLQPLVGLRRALSSLSDFLSIDRVESEPLRNLYRIASELFRLYSLKFSGSTSSEEVSMAKSKQNPESLDELRNLVSDVLRACGDLTPVASRVTVRRLHRIMDQLEEGRSENLDESDILLDLIECLTDHIVEMAEMEADSRGKDAKHLTRDETYHNETTKQVAGILHETLNNVSEELLRLAEILNTTKKIQPSFRDSIRTRNSEAAMATQSEGEFPPGSGAKRKILVNVETRKSPKSTKATIPVGDRRKQRLKCPEDEPKRTSPKKQIERRKIKPVSALQRSPLKRQESPIHRTYGGTQSLLGNTVTASPSKRDRQKGKRLKNMKSQQQHKGKLVTPSDKEGELGKTFSNISSQTSRSCLTNLSSVPSVDKATSALDLTNTDHNTSSEQQREIISDVVEQSMRRALNNLYPRTEAPVQSVFRTSQESLGLDMDTEIASYSAVESEKSKQDLHLQSDDQSCRTETETSVSALEETSHFSDASLESSILSDTSSQDLQRTPQQAVSGNGNVLSVSSWEGIAIRLTALFSEETLFSRHSCVALLNL